MSLIISTGSNLNNRLSHLQNAKLAISQVFNLQHESRVYESPAVDYTDQGAFLNQVLELKIPLSSPQKVLSLLLEIENDFGRVRDIDKGPRTLDIDILFWKTDSIHKDNLVVPHPRLFERSFIVLPLKELPYFSTLKKHFEFSDTFNNKAWPFQP